MSEISNAFKVKKGLDVVGTATLHGDLSVAGNIIAPVITGVAVVPTALPGTATSQPASTQFVTAAIGNISSFELLTWAYGEVFQVVSATRDSNEVIITANIVWPDSATGVFTTDKVSTAFPGAIDAWHSTHILAGTTKTITQAAVSRDAQGGITSQPAITVV